MEIILKTKTEDGKFEVMRHVNTIDFCGDKIHVDEKELIPISEIDMILKERDNLSDALDDIWNRLFDFQDTVYVKNNNELSDLIQKTMDCVNNLDEYLYAQ